MNFQIILIVIVLYNIFTSTISYHLNIPLCKSKYLQHQLYSNNKNYETQDIINITKIWIESMISTKNIGICPYTQNADLAGIPTGKIRYEVSNANDISQAYEDYWKEVFLLQSSLVYEITTTLLIYPNVFEFQNIENFETFSLELDAAVEEAMLSAEIDNVYFHPEYKFVDKEEQVYLIFSEDTGEIIGDSKSIVSPVSYARRSPIPFVNILRSPMVKAVQKNLPEGKVFSDNIKKLDAIGANQLQNMLNNRSWNEL